MLNKKNLPLLIALAIPGLMIILVAAFIYLPGAGKQPQYNFLYLTGRNSYYDSFNREYTVNSGGRVVYLPIPTSTQSSFPSRQDNSQPRFYLYNMTDNTATELTFEQAQSYKLDSSSASPDGYVVERGNNSGGGLFFGGFSRDYNSWFIKGHNRSKKLNLKLTGTEYYNFQFLGWVVD